MGLVILYSIWINCFESVKDWYHKLCPVGALAETSAPSRPPRQYHVLIGTPSEPGIAKLPLHQPLSLPIKGFLLRYYQFSIINGLLESLLSNTKEGQFPNIFLSTLPLRWIQSECRPVKRDLPPYHPLLRGTSSKPVNSNVLYRCSILLAIRILKRIRSREGNVLMLGGPQNG